MADEVSAGQPAPQPKAQGLFSHQPKASQDPAAIAGVQVEVNDLIRRLKMLEERYSGLRNKTQMTDQNMLNNQKKNIIEVKSLSEELKDMRKELSEVDAKLRLVIKEIGLTAKKEDVELLKKYVNLWEPIKFVTQDEVMRIVEDAIEDKVSERFK